MKADAGIFLTGANGAVGRQIYSLLSKAGHTVWPLVRSEEQAAPWRQQAERVIVGDVCNLSALPAGVHHIIHAAASPITPDRFEKDNVDATRHLVQLAEYAGVRSFVYFSAMSVYGAVQSEKVDEHTPINNPDPYGLSKLLGEQLVLEASPGIVPIILRMPGIIGAGAHRNWLSRVKADMVAGRPIHFYNAAAVFNNAVHMEDLAQLCANIISAESAAGIYTLAAKGVVPILHMLELMREALNSESELIELSSPHVSWTISIDKAEQTLGYQAMNIEDMVVRYAMESQ